MKAHIKIETKKGLYAETTVKLSNVADVAKATITFLDKLPDVIGEEHVMDWTTINIEITRTGTN